MEARRPMTRSRLEAQIAKIQEDLDDAIGRKAYTEAGPLQDDLEALIGKRTELPTTEELRDAVATAELAVADAAKNRDFAAAASLQSNLKDARMRLEAALEAEVDSGEESNDEDSVEEEAETSIDGIESRSDLEQEIASLQSQVEAAISQKDFKKASELQIVVEEREQLRKFFPSLGELEEQLREAMQSLDEAVSQKDFSKAEKLNVEIDKLEKKVQSEREKEESIVKADPEQTKPSVTNIEGETITFDSRAALDKEITATQALQGDAIKNKKFKKAENLEKVIDQLMKLREDFPTIVELQKRIKEKQNEMQKAISSKNFSEAERIDNDINLLEEKLSVEKKLAPESEPPKTNTMISSVKQTPTLMPNISTPFKVQKENKPVIVSTPNSVLKSTMKNKSNKPKTVIGLPYQATLKPPRINKSKAPKTSSLEDSEFRPVSKLRPKKPLVSSSDDSILSVTQMLASKRGDASLVVSESGGLAGIITDTDITRRVVAKHVDAASTSVAAVMTPNPTCVAMSDSAMDAMSTMVENHFRHLPVVDENGGVVGLLDIAKCLNDAITKLERSQSKGGDDASAALSQAMKAQGAQGAQAAALQALLGPLMAQALGNQTSPTLRSLLAGKPSTVVSPGTSVLDAGMLMAERRKAALVVEDGQLVGIFGFKDMMTRVIAKELPVELTDITKVMTPNPEAVSPEMTVLEALQTMHDNKFLTLPVCEDNGGVVGLVDVMDVIYGCGGVEGWRSIFSSSLDMDDLSDSASQYSGRVDAVGSVSRSIKSRKSNNDVSKDTRTVSMLRPRKALVAGTDNSILSVAQMLSDNRGCAGILVSRRGDLAGIITDTDMTRRVVSKHIDTGAVPISHVMTPDPKCVSINDSAMEAMMTMIENRFRHLPVADDEGAVVGVLDIAKCLNDAISKLEHCQDQGSKTTERLMKQALEGQGAAALQALLGPLVTQAFGNQSTRALRSILEGRPTTMVPPDASVLNAATLMSNSRKAALVVEDGELIGIFGFKDMMTRVIAKELDVNSTVVADVMTPEPEFVSPEMTVLEALQTMHDNRFLTLPVCEDDGTVVGIVDVMDVIYGCGDVDAWRSVFDSALDLDGDFSDNESAQIPIVNSKGTMSSTPSPSVPLAKKDPVITVSRDAPFVSPILPNNIPTTLEFQEGQQHDFDDLGLTIHDSYMEESHAPGRIVLFKIVDPSGQNHRLRAELRLSSLLEAFSEKVQVGKKAIRFKFVDDEGDAVLITSDADLIEAYSQSRPSATQGGIVVKLTAEVFKESAEPDPMILAGVGAAVAVFGLGFMILLRPRR